MLSYPEHHRIDIDLCRSNGHFQAGKSLLVEASSMLFGSML